MGEPSKMRIYAKKLRREATKEENHLWYDFLRTCPLQFRRQVVFGYYIVDFYCAKAKLVIELDGSQHYMDDGPNDDEKRTAYLQERYGLSVLRFTNLDVKDNFEGVCIAISQAIEPACLQEEKRVFPLRGKVPPKEVNKRPSTTREGISIMKQVTIYTDGACSGNPGPGGWGAILCYGPHKKEISGGEDHTTNNRMELTGVISALKLLKEPCEVELYSDSKYVIDALEKGWARGWQKRGWVKSNKKPALNPDLWEELLRLCDIHTVHTHWVKGHADNPYNNRCDEMAVAEWQKRKG